MSDTATALSGPPRAVKKPHSFTHHHITVEDPYNWLRDPGYPRVTDEEILTHLKAENAWFETRMAPHEGLIETLFKEMRARIKEDDGSVPQKDGDWYYWVEYQEGAQYKQWWRKPAAGGRDGTEGKVVILDEAALAEGHEYFRLGAFSVSMDGTKLAYAIDTDGSERFNARIKDLTTGELLEDTIPGTLGSLVWVAGDSGIVYSLANENWRTDNARLHRIGTPIADDVELFHEDDEGFRVGSGLSADEKWLVIGSSDHETSEVRLVPAADPTAAPILVRERKAGVEYDVDVAGDTVWVHTNDDHENFRLAKAPLAAPGAWETVLEGSDDFYLTGFDLFRDFFVTEGRLAGLDQVQVRRYDNPTVAEPVEFPEASYSAGMADNPEFDTQVLRLSYNSMITPGTVYEYDPARRELTVLKVQEIPSGYDASQYRTERVTITARDGTEVPVSLMMRADTPLDGTAPLHLYGYGAYGHAISPYFSTGRLSLVDRGFIFAIAHIRGGDDLGRRWYKDGKLTKRTNTFNDFVDVAKGLIAKGYSSKGRVTASGGSAGGELMGAIVNSDPDIWGAVVAQVPFVDVLNTMLDASLPLTPGEWPEWGNPIEDPAAFDLIRSYSPYDQVKAQAYPPMLVTGGLNDPRVTYWEPAKWVARLREMKTDENELLMKMNMGAGHGGKSGRFDSLREIAEEYAFVLWQTGTASA
ncbi:S9 family peptidase [Croceicoccus naphthovorans]|uniref:Peptidase S9 n=1 Tax=Croceicoccus naphthovorans TaxID=1348774 RepID=A0A0G3XI64_9SPHN|nr:S9 family peptidase [Croceicoccus naphthovorans]AKM11260.1 peptidase S9 [Croceicoccus naphthovorans]MBB3989832.1 oligopeptidase B [Croceicoccus naphthovorans]